MGQTLDWALSNDKFIITLCHGPAALLAATLGKAESPFANYSICVFPDALDQGPNQDVGYLPGPLPWLAAERLAEQGLTILNDDVTGKTHRDRTVLTGDSPLASNGLGLLAADALTQAVRETADQELKPTTAAGRRSRTPPARVVEQPGTAGAFEPHLTGDVPAEIRHGTPGGHRRDGPGGCASRAESQRRPVSVPQPWLRKRPRTAAAANPLSRQPIAGGRPVSHVDG
ncbi:MAG: protein deglycase HchA [Amycolatopsis sp.]|uniref:hypothetical protein n=1 Tax=Amycolatopsis sp. TaxID=37632 RepID=UPI002624AB98|nr:hypothetical protein [Amycolatopsis sp.]MCU1682790.1 protein deglycase HchA [Amycolatopsis sp.]